MNVKGLFFTVQEGINFLPNWYWSISNRRTENGHKLCCKSGFSAHSESANAESLEEFEQKLPYESLPLLIL